MTAPTVGSFTGSSAGSSYAQASETTRSRNGAEGNLAAAPASSVERRLAPCLSGIGQEEAKCSVYVVRLEREVLGKKKFADANPERSDSGLCLYVGQTAHSPSDRFQKHKSGHRASRWVRDYGIELLPRFYEPLNKMGRHQAEEVEKILAGFLRLEGHAVWQK